MHPNRHLSRRIVLVCAVLFVSASIASAHPGSGIAVDKAGCVYFVDSGSGLWKIDAAGRITKIPGAAYHWMALDAKDAFARTRLPRERNTDMSAVNANPTILLASDYPIAVGSDDCLYYPHKPREQPLRLMRMNPAGTAVAVGDIPPSTNGPLEWINGLATGPDGSLYYTDDQSIWRMTSKGQVTRVATISVAAGATLTPGHVARMGSMLRGLAVDSKGVIFVAATADGRVLKVAPDGKTETVLQVQSPWSPTAVALHGGDVYVLEYLHTTGDDRKEWLPRVRKITPDGKSTIIATVDKMPGAR